MKCPHCEKRIADKLILSQAAKIMRSRGGYSAPKKLKPCPFCGESKGVVEMRKHIPQCRKSNPENGILTATGDNLDSLVRPITRKFGEPDAALRERFLNRLGD
jgi:sarcosine oxidase delta subunit